MHSVRVPNGILRGEPDWSLIPVWPEIPKLLRRTLQKDANKRIHDIADVRLEILEAIEAGGPGVIDAMPITVQAGRQRTHVWKLPLAGIVFLALAALFI